MDYLEQPEIKDTYNKCKLIVKVWEHKFTKKYKRIPSKVSKKYRVSYIINNFIAVRYSRSK